MADQKPNDKDEFVISDKTFNDRSLVVNTDGSINVSGIVANYPSATSISKYVGEGKVFTFSANITAATSGADNALLLIRNPAASGKILYLYRSIFGVNIQNTWCDFRIKSGPTITAVGTTATPINNYIGNATTSSMNVYTLPTATGGSQLADVIVGQNTNSFDFLGDFSIWLPANRDLLVTGAPSGPNKIVVVTLVWAEV